MWIIAHTHVSDIHELSRQESIDSVPDVSVMLVLEGERSFGWNFSRDFTTNMAGYLMSPLPERTVAEMTKAHVWRTVNALSPSSVCEWKN